MFEQELKSFSEMSQLVGNRADYVQGGGGNTSVKLGGEWMAIKASGFRLSQITEETGYVVVNAKTIRHYYESVDLTEDRDFEKESVMVAKDSISKEMGPQGLRPSVEAGFHAVLGNYVVHTHSVYANVICCSYEGATIVKELFTDAGEPALWIPYINPGFCLTLRIMSEMKTMEALTGKKARIIFMENHGLIVWADTAEEAVALHDKVNDVLRTHYPTMPTFPVPTLSVGVDGLYQSATPDVAAFMRREQPNERFFEAFPLYPDQLVYLNTNFSGGPDRSKIILNSDQATVSYRAGQSEAMVMEETLLGYVYVLAGITATGLTLKTMTEQDVDFIRNWESEAYRKSLVKSSR